MVGSASTFVIFLIMSDRTFARVFCENTFNEHGHDAAPVVEGFCCDLCHNKHVLPWRIATVSKVLEGKEADSIENVLELLGCQKQDPDMEILHSPKRVGLSKNQRKKENRRRRSTIRSKNLEGFTADELIVAFNLLLSGQNVQISNEQEKARNDVAAMLIQQNDRRNILSKLLDKDEPSSQLLIAIKATAQLINGVKDTHQAIITDVSLIARRQDWFFVMEDDNSFYKFSSNDDFAKYLPVDGDGVYRCGWEVASMRCVWLLCAYDPDEEIAYGFVNMGDNGNAEYGAIGVKELREIFQQFKLSSKQLYPLHDTFANGPVHGDDLKKGPLKGYLRNL